MGRSQRRPPARAAPDSLLFPLAGAAGHCQLSLGPSQRVPTSPSPRLTSAALSGGWGHGNSPRKHTVTPGRTHKTCVEPARRILGAGEGCPASLCLGETEKRQVWGPRASPGGVPAATCPGTWGNLEASFVHSFIHSCQAGPAVGCRRKHRQTDVALSAEKRPECSQDVLLSPRFPRKESRPGAAGDRCPATRLPLGGCPGRFQKRSPSQALPWPG